MSHRKKWQSESLFSFAVASEKIMLFENPTADRRDLRASKASFCSEYNLRV